MAFETGSAIDLEDLIAKISTFATANGWTEDRRDNAAGIFGLSKNSIFVSSRWDTTALNVLSIHQATAVLPGAGTEPGDVTGDSGNGYNATTAHTDSLLDNERHVVLGDGPFPSYYLFEQDASPAYLHIVVETSTNIFQHFGFGEINKVGDAWTGGEYCYGQRHIAAGGINNNSTFLLDGFFTDAQDSDKRWAATMRCSGMPSQPGSEVWGQIWGQAVTIPPTDSAANNKARLQGGHRAGPFSWHWGYFSGIQTVGFVPMYAMAVWYLDDANNHVYLLGWHPDVRAVNIRGFAPKDEVVIGSDTWVFFPLQQRDISGGAGTTGFSGVAYKKVTA